MYLPSSHREEGLLGFRAPGCHGGETQHEDISDYRQEDEDGRSNLCLNHERSERRVSLSSVSERSKDIIAAFISKMRRDD